MYSGPLLQEMFLRFFVGTSGKEVSYLSAYCIMPFIKLAYFKSKLELGITSHIINRAGDSILFVVCVKAPQHLCVCLRSATAKWRRWRALNAQNS